MKSQRWKEVKIWYSSKRLKSGEKWQRTTLGDHEIPEEVEVTTVKVNTLTTNFSHIMLINWRDQS